MSTPKPDADMVVALAEAYARARADVVTTGHVTAKVYADLARSNLVDAIAALAAQPRQLVMADGKASLLDYLARTSPEGTVMDEWTAGYEECKRRLHKILAPQLTAEPTPGVAVPEGWRVRKNDDGSIGLHAPPPRDGESRRTSECFTSKRGNDVNEIVFKLLSHMLADAPRPPKSVEREAVERMVWATHDWLGANCNGEPPRLEVAGLCALAEAVLSVPETPAPRSDQEIVAQTEELAALLLKEVYGLTGPAKLREDKNPRAKFCWALACRVQEMLTDTDPENSVSEVDDAGAAGAGLCRSGGVRAGAGVGGGVATQVQPGVV